MLINLSTRQSAPARLPPLQRIALRLVQWVLYYTPLGAAWYSGILATKGGVQHFLEEAYASQAHAPAMFEF